MEKRNFNILVLAICIGITAFWWSAHNYVRLGIDPIKYIEESSSNIFIKEEEEEEKIVITIIGKVKKELELSLDDLKSDDYRQITRESSFKNKFVRELTQ